MSDSARPELASFRELELLVKSLGDELANFRRRALQAEARLKAIDAAGQSGNVFSSERLIAVERENSVLRKQLGTAAEHTRQVLDQVRFLRQQHDRRNER